MISLPSEIPRDIPGLWSGYQTWLAERGVRTARVVLHGGYGKNNLGDDAILHVLIERTLEHLPGAQITVVCHGPENVARRYQHVSGLSACYFKSGAALRAIVKSHIYIIGGGGIVNKINAYSGRQTMKLLDMKGKFLFIAAALAKVTGAQTCFYAIGATSFPDRGVKALAKPVLNGATVVSVRDERSLQNLETIGVQRPIVQVLDPALSLKPAPRAEAEEVLRKWGVPGVGRRVCVGFRFVRDGATDNDAKVQAAARFCDHLIKRCGGHVVFLPASQHPSEHYEDDLEFGRRVRSALAEAKSFSLIEEYYHPTLMMAVLGAMDFNVLERLHAVILTSLTEVPFFVVSYDAKVTEYAKLVGAVDRLITSEDFVNRGDYGWLDRELAFMESGCV